jgi:sporulation protein YlmC with PRC-barrel domain
MGRLPVLGAAVLLAMSGIAHGQSQDQSKLPAKSVTPKEAPKPPPPAAPPHVVKPKEQADSLLGKQVYGTDGQQMGLVTNILIDREGHPIALVIDFGGFLGVGSRKIAVDWHLMQFHPGDKDKPVTLRLTKDQLKSAPEYRPNKSTAPVIYAPAPAPLPAKPATKATSSSKPPTATPDHNEPK